MKKKIMLFTIVASALLGVTGCNRQMIDTTYTYNYAIIVLPDGGVIEGKIDSWRDFEDGDQLQVKINGVTYLTSSYRCTLINK